ncbi:Vitamin B12 ABC transporter, B12-binding component BtuF [Desulfurella amilsii]|uniref:Vitamin B12 ABC transporter, B12-binding component BtuF n=1 Tax=Desulfurella amilsii TaxID=1562698 RepID=A0A1X4XVH0_9BACT|nr:ABC transporter substrate-binding protein [Desulfurella amilsii]OSS41515.1 Vitamin B12 ABC transporter, B12-binding component BtuF [Desulfurella amilsii]
MKKLFLVLFVLLIFLPKAWSSTITVYNFGKKVEINNTKRFVVLFPQALPFVFMINAQDGLVGYPGMGRDAMPYFSGQLILKKMPSFKQKVADVGYPFGPSIEKIVSLKPGFIVNVNMQANNEQFKKLGIPVIAFSACFGNLNDLYESIKSLGEATNHAKEAQNLISYYKNTVSFVGNHLKDIKEKPKVLYLSYQGPQGNKLTSGGQFDTLVNDIIQKAGGISVSKNVKGKFGQISKEDILKWNPQYIFLGTGNQKAISDIYHDKDLHFVSAVVHKKVFLVPQDSGGLYSNWFAPEKAPLGLLWCAKILHTKHFESLDLKAQAQYYYKTFWGINLNQIHINWQEN